MAEIDDLECNRPEGLSKDEWRWVTNINEQMCALMEEQRCYATAVDQLMSERGHVMDNIKELRDQRDALNQEIHAKTARPVLQSLKGTF